MFLSITNRPRDMHVFLKDVEEGRVRLCGAKGLKLEKKSAKKNQIRKKGEAPKPKGLIFISSLLFS
jgi:hypothetical protein